MCDKKYVFASAGNRRRAHNFLWKANRRASLLCLLQYSFHNQQPAAGSTCLNSRTVISWTFLRYFSLNYIYYVRGFEYVFLSMKPFSSQSKIWTKLAKRVDPSVALHSAWSYSLVPQMQTAWCLHQTAIFLLMSNLKLIQELMIYLEVQLQILLSSLYRYGGFA